MNNKPKCKITNFRDGQYMNIRTLKFIYALDLKYWF